LEQVFAKGKEKEETDKQKMQRINVNTIKSEKKSSVTLQSAFENYMSIKIITQEDVVAHINRAKLSSDAANGKNMKELTIQWEQHKHKINDFFKNKDSNI
jgi:hypothetical protein